MKLDILLGLIFLFISLSILLYFFLWSRKIISFIDEHKLKSAREILKKLNERR
ncbi:hypothetical protein ACFLT9_11225 [Acidobacteriota bacterium]